MNPQKSALAQRYRQQIAEHINNDPARYADLSANAADRHGERPPRGGASPAAEPELRPTGIELQWHRVAGPAHHTLLRVTPTDQARYENDPRFSNVDEQGRRYATIGAGPDPLVSGMVFNGKLKSDYNRPSDVEPHGPGLMIQPLTGMSEDDFINRLFKLDREYADNLTYDVGTNGPYKGYRNIPIAPQYDSNSYISGLLQAAGVEPPEPPVWAPGYGDRVMPGYFGR